MTLEWPLCAKIKCGCRDAKLPLWKHGVWKYLKKSHFARMSHFRPNDWPKLWKKIMTLFWGIFKYCAEVSSLCHRGHFDIDSTLSILLDPRKFLHKPTFFSIAKIDDLLDFWAAKKVEKTEIEQDGRTKDKPLRPSANFFYCLDLSGIYLLVPSS